VFEEDHWTSDLNVKRQPGTNGHGKKSRWLSNKAAELQTTTQDVFLSLASLPPIFCIKINWRALEEDASQTFALMPEI